MTQTTADAGRTANPSAFDNGVMSRKYGFSRESCHKPDAERIVWQMGWDDENARRAALAAAKGAK